MIRTEYEANGLLAMQQPMRARAKVTRHRHVKNSHARR